MPDNFRITSTESRITLTDARCRRAVRTYGTDSAPQATGLGHSIRLHKTKGEARVEPRLMPRFRSQITLSEGMLKRNQILPERAKPEVVSNHIANGYIQRLLFQDAGSGDAERKLLTSNGFAETRNQINRCGDIQHTAELRFGLDSFARFPHIAGNLCTSARTRFQSEILGRCYP